MPQTHKYLSLVALAPNNVDLASSLVTAFKQRNCVVIECHLSPLGRHTAAKFLISGNWSALGKLESALPGLTEQMGILIQSCQSNMVVPTEDYRPYMTELVAPQQPTLLSDLLHFFESQSVHVVEINAQSYNSAHTGASLCNVNMALHVPLNQHPHALRESFMDLCDELHADGIFDPVKS